MHLQGNKLYLPKKNFVAGIHNINLDLATIDSGLYIVTLASGESIQYSKLQIIR